MADMKKKDFTSSIKTNGHNFTATITTSALDRDNEVLLPMGMRRGNFDNNPVVFWNHDYDTPIGKAVKLNQDNNSWSAFGVSKYEVSNSEFKKFIDEGKEVYLVEIKDKDPSEMGFKQFTNLIQKTFPLTYSDLMEKKIMLS